VIFFFSGPELACKWIPRKVVHRKSAADRSPPQPHPHIIIIIDIHMQRKKEEKQKRRHRASVGVIVLCWSLRYPNFLYTIDWMTGCEEMWRCGYDMIYGETGSVFYVTALDSPSWFAHRFHFRFFFVNAK